ncbi:MAG: hypothetical protein R3B05_14575 [Nitrospira sp.]
MKRTRRNHGAAFKAQVALAAVKGLAGELPTLIRVPDLRKAIS